MSEQVTPAPKAYQANVFWDRQDCATLSAQVYLASDADSYIDALHAEAEALRAGAGAWKAKAEEALNDWRKACQLNGDAAEREFKLHAELEAARGLIGQLHAGLRSLKESVFPDDPHGTASMHEFIDALLSLTATPAPEVPGHTERNLEMARQALSAENQRVVPPEPIIAPPHPFDKPSLLKDCNVTYSNSSRPLAEQGERQEAACWVPRACLDKLRNGCNNSPAVLTDGPAEFNDTPLYAVPQPGPDVRALVEALEQADEYLSHNKLNEIGSGSILHRAMQEALAAHRQAQQGGSHDT